MLPCLWESGFLNLLEYVLDMESAFLKRVTRWALVRFRKVN